MTRFRQVSAIVVNLVIPGGGMIILRREWLGMAIVLLFVLFAQIAVFGWLIVPLDVPTWIAWSAGVAAAVIWAVSQWLAVVRLRFLASPELAAELAELEARARAAMSREDWNEARQSLLVATRLDDENVALAALQAELLTRAGNTRGARRIWKRVLAMAPDGAYREQALRSLEG
jgi:hypothetical protein